jgi:hypothetical protein
LVPSAVHVLSGLRFGEAITLTGIEEGPVRDVLTADSRGDIECSLANFLGSTQQNSVGVEVRAHSRSSLIENGSMSSLGNIAVCSPEISLDEDTRRSETLGHLRDI